MQDYEFHPYFIGLGTELMVQVHGIDSSLKSFLIGVEPKSCLIIGFPKAPGTESKFYIGNSLKIIFMHSGKVHAFISKILSIIKNPSRMLIIEYPAKIKLHELRDSIRIDCYFPSTLRMVSSNREYDGFILDISASGCKFAATHEAIPHQAHIEIEEDVLLSFKHTVIEGVPFILGKVKNVSREELKIFLGIRFDASTFETLEKIGSYIRDIALFSHA